MKHISLRIIILVTLFVGLPMKAMELSPKEYERIEQELREELRALVAKKEQLKKEYLKFQSYGRYATKKETHNREGSLANVLKYSQNQ